MKSRILQFIVRKWRGASYFAKFGKVGLIIIEPFTSEQRLNLLGRFMDANHLKFGSQPQDKKTYPEIEILFVSTKKDFEVLLHSIKFARIATAHHGSAKVVVIVPKSELLLASGTLKNLEGKVEIHAEESFLSENIIRSIKDRFAGRAGWVIQQLLKTSYVSTSSSNGVLVIDSDTLLLTKRVWLEHDGTQILTPSWEYHKPYYEFLEAHLGITSYPKFTFVSHHMLMQPEIMREALSASGWSNLDNLVEELILESDPTENSPFCIEFELYGQYIYKNHSNLVNLCKWGNLGVARTSFSIDDQIAKSVSQWSRNFASVSLHSYLK